MTIYDEDINFDEENIYPCHRFGGNSLGLGAIFCSTSRHKSRYGAIDNTSVQGGPQGDYPPAGAWLEYLQGRPAHPLNLL